MGILYTKTLSHKKIHEVARALAPIVKILSNNTMFNNIFLLQLRLFFSCLCFISLHQKSETLQTKKRRRWPANSTMDAKLGNQALFWLTPLSSKQYRWAVSSVGSHITFRVNESLPPIFCKFPANSVNFREPNFVRVNRQIIGRVAGQQRPWWSNWPTRVGEARGWSVRVRLVSTTGCGNSYYSGNHPS